MNLLDFLTVRLLVSFLRDRSSISLIPSIDQLPILCILRFQLANPHTFKEKSRIKNIKRNSSNSITLFSAMRIVLLFEVFSLASESCLSSLAWNFNRSRSNLTMASANERSNFVCLLRDLSNSYSRSDKWLFVSSNCSSWRMIWLFKSECWNKREFFFSIDLCFEMMKSIYSKCYFVNSTL